MACARSGNNALSITQTVIRNTKNTSGLNKQWRMEPDKVYIPNTVIISYFTIGLRANNEI